MALSVKDAIKDTVRFSFTVGISFFVGAIAGMLAEDPVVGIAVFLICVVIIRQGLKDIPPGDDE